MGSRKDAPNKDDSLQLWFYWPQLIDAHAKNRDWSKWEARQHEFGSQEGVDLSGPDVLDAAAGMVPSRLKHLRSSMGLSQGGLSKVAGVSQSKIATSEKVRDLSAGELLHIAAALNVHPETVLGTLSSDEAWMLAAYEAATHEQKRFFIDSIAGVLGDKCPPNKPDDDEVAPDGWRELPIPVPMAIGPLRDKADRSPD